MSLPTRKQINPYDHLDGQSAERDFFGKDLAAAETMFQECAAYTEDLQFMGPVAFQYYVQAAIRYLRSDAATRGFIGGFFCALQSQFEVNSEELVPIAGELASICGYIVEHHDRLGLPPMSAEEMSHFVELLR
ncbi:MAG: hypothetical protein JWM11_5928, partial [Planctomycetaceae bacterium]|nr:hypothetical protein [Planctomycetaceae bacterium]